MSAAFFPPMNTMLARLAEASRKKQILRFHTFAPPQSFGMQRTSAGRDWAMPSFNFGRLDDVGHSADAWSRTVWDEMWRQGSDHITAGTFRVPFAECVYLFRYSEDQSRYESVNLLHLVTSGDEITGECYSWSPNAPGHMCEWTKSPWQFTITNGSSIEWAIEPQFEAQLPAHLAARYHEDAKAAYTKVICATMLLAEGCRSSEATEYVAGVNRGRALGKLAPLPDTVSLRFGQTTLSRSYPARGSSGARQPHDRRGHYRTLRSGRVVPVRSSKIHGGADQSRTYSIGAV